MNVTEAKRYLQFMQDNLNKYQKAENQTDKETFANGICLAAMNIYKHFINVHQ